MDWHELQKHKVDELRAMMKEHLPEVTGVTAMKKEQLVEMLAEKLGIERPHKVVTGLDKTAVKARIRELKKLRQQALEAGDHDALVRHRRAIHHLKRKLRKAARLA